MSDSENKEKKTRKRSLTEITLGWIAERVRHAEKIKAEVSKGTYKVDTQKIAASLVNEE